MAIFGGEIVPELQGLIADRIGIHHAFFLPVICYRYIFYYALAGSKPTANAPHGARRHGIAAEE
jgi:FHS family L-fucose permease-like MFS transporter